jgi:hypothetical protein
MKALFIINNEGYHQSAKIVDKLLNYIDISIKEAVVKFDIVEDSNDINVYNEFKEASVDDDYDVYILNFVHYTGNYDDISGMLEKVGYNNDTTSIVILNYSDITKYNDQINDYLTGKLLASDLKF